MEKKVIKISREVDKEARREASEKLAGFIMSLDEDFKEDENDSDSCDGVCDSTNLPD